MKIILNTNFQIESIEDEKASRIVKGSNLFDELGVYIPQALYDSYTSIYPSYSVKRADNRQLGEYAMATADNTSVTGYYGWKTHLHQRDLAVAGPLEITISFALNGTVKKTICKVTANVDSAIELSNDVFIVTRGENDEILAIESLVDAVEDLQQECTQVSNTLLTKADLDNANQEITAKSVEAETFEQDGNNVLDSSDVVDNVTTEDATKVLSAKQGKVLKALIDALTTSLSTEYYKKAQTYSSTEIDGLIANFVTKSVNDLTNYYLKSETYNKTEIDNMLSTLSSFEVVQALPTENIKTSVIYLLQNGQFYDEYIYSNNDWVMIGTTNIDFSDYYTKAQINAMLNVINEAINGVDIVNEEVVFEADIPSSAKGLATLGKVGGMSYKSENLLNITNVAETTTNGVTYSATNGTYILNGTANANGSIYKAISLSLKAGTYVLNSFNTKVRTYISINNVDYDANTPFTLNSDFSGTAYYNIYFASGTIFTNDLFKPMLVKGSTAPTEYQPYFEGIRDSAVTSVVSKDSNNTAIATQPIASEIQALDGYGWGVNDTCYNYIDFAAKKFVQKVGRVDLGSLNWSYDSTYHFFYFTISYLITQTSYSDMPNILCSKYTAYSHQTWDNLSEGITILNNTNNIAIKDSAYTNATAFKSAMSGVYLYYELATPIETDISSYLGDKHIPIEANGSLTFTNTYNQAVPSSITYDCGLVEVVKTNHEHDLEQQKDIDTLKANQKQLQTDVSGLDTRLDDVEETAEDIPQLLTDVSNLKDDVDNLETDVSGLQTSKQNAFQNVVVGTTEITINKTGLYCITYKSNTADVTVTTLCRIVDLNTYYLFKNSDGSNIKFNDVGIINQKFTLQGSSAYHFLECKAIFTDN